MKHRQRPEDQLLGNVYGFPRLQLVRGAGCEVWDVDGQRYLDFTAGLGVMALGHGNPAMAQAVHDQLLQLDHCSNLFGNLPAAELAQQLLETAPFAERLWFGNSGAEVCDAALKFARLYGRAVGGAERTGILAFEGSFHGRTVGAVSITYNPAYRQPFMPLLGPVQFVPFNDLAAAAAAMGPHICAVVVEPVQGEGGVVPGTCAFMRGLRHLCDRHGAALIFDEIQCGLVRTGCLYAHHNWDVEPDMLLLAKPLAGGLPIGVVLMNAAIAGLLRPGQHGSTFAGGPVIARAAQVVLAALRAPALLRQVNARASQLAARLHALLPQQSLFGAHRGLGLMQGLVVGDPARHPPAEIVQQAQARGLLVTRAGADVIRLLPPLVVDAAQIDRAVDILTDVAQACT